MKLCAAAQLALLIALGGAALSGQTPGGATTTKWVIADGEAGGPAEMDTLIAVANPSTTDGLAGITLQFDDGSIEHGTLALPPGARAELSIADQFPSADGRRFVVVVESLGRPAPDLSLDWFLYSKVSGVSWMPPVSEAAGATPTRGSRIASTHEGNQSAVLSSAPAGRSIAASSTLGAAAYNLKIVSDASPDLSDLDSLIHSTTSRWPSIPEKVWALFYWTHILKRQTAPIVLHGFEVTDPIRNFTDYGFTMCSTISGINQSLYERLGVRHQYWDLCNHSVSAVEYGGRFRMVDSSMSNLVTTDDGVTLASVEEAAADGARLVRERSLYATSANGFLTGTDQMRNLADTVNPTDGTIISGFAANFCADGLKFRDYYYNWDAGHRYVLNLRENETYTRYYQRLGTIPDYWVGSERSGAPNPDSTYEIEPSDRFGMRGNGRWSLSPSLSPDAWSRAVYRATNIAAAADGLRPAAADQPSEVVYKVQAANAVTSQNIHARFARTDAAATATISVSVNHGLTWIDVASVGTSEGPDVQAIASLRGEVNGMYETLVRIQMRTRGSQAGRRAAEGSDDRNADAGQRQSAAKAEPRQKRDHDRDRRSVRHHGALARPARRSLAQGRLPVTEHRVAARVGAAEVHRRRLSRCAAAGRAPHVPDGCAGRDHAARLRRAAPQLQSRFVHRFPAFVRRRQPAGSTRTVSAR